jgi:hypothetical protein
VSDDLHTRLHAAITARLEEARAATPGPWGAHPVHMFMDGRVQARIGPVGRPRVFADVISGGDFQFFRIHDPADAIRRYERDLRVWERHAPIGGVGGVRWCADFDKLTGAEYGLDWPCDDYTDLLDVYPEVTR